MTLAGVDLAFLMEMKLKQCLEILEGMLDGLMELVPGLILEVVPKLVLQVVVVVPLVVVLEVSLGKVETAYPNFL